MAELWTWLDLETISTRAVATCGTNALTEMLVREITTGIVRAGVLKCAPRSPRGLAGR
jgi:hypothetical protein